MSGLDVLAAPAAVVGIVGFAFQSLSGCIKGFQLISTACQVGKHAVHYRCAILLEEERLLLWAKRSGLANGNLDARLNVAIIHQVLAELANILTSTDKLSQRYKLNVVGDDAPDSDTSHYDSLSGGDLSFLQSDTLSKERERLLAKAEAIKKHVPFKRFWFAAVDQAKFKELLHDIRELIQSLYDLLSLNAQEDILRRLEVQRSEMLRATSQLSDLRAMIEAYNLSEVGNIPEKTMALLRAVELVPNPGSGDKGLIRDLQDLMNEASQTKYASLTPIFTNRLKESKLMRPDCPRGSVLYDGKTHYVEWKGYSWGGSKESRDRILDSIVNLAILLNAPKHPAFRTLDCVGITDEPRNSRYMYMYRWPVESEQPTAPRILHELLSSSFKPSLTDRIALARQLVRALFYLHLANWMHKSISSHNILFFSESSDSPRTLNNPYMVGFSYARPDAVGEPSQKLDQDPDSDIYRHPNCLEKDDAGFHKSYDVYSLGLVLYEIVKWRPLKETFLRTARAKALAAQNKTEKELTKEDLGALNTALLKECKVQDIKDMRKELLDPAVKDSQPIDLAFRAGDNLASVVLTCLGDTFDKIRKDGDDRTLRETFFERVWKPLEKLAL